MSFPSLFVIVTFFLSKLIVATTGWFVASVISYEILPFGTFLSIQSTFAVAVPLFPSSFVNSNVNVPFSVNVYVSFPLLFVIVKFWSPLSKVATTSLFVFSVISYLTVALGVVLSIQSTFAVALPSFP